LNTVVVPSILVITNERAFRDPRELSFRPSDRKEIALLTDVGTTVHGKVSNHGQPIHEGKMRFIFSAVPGTENDSRLFSRV
jgi:hypothetical protein